MQALGNQVWQPLSILDTDAGFGCGAAPNVVHLFREPDTFVSIEYSATGTGAGAQEIHMDYSASSTKIPVKNESTYRQVYVNFLAEMVQMALKEPLPDLARKKILNLNSYYGLGVQNEESFIVGEGFFILSRNQKAGGLVVEVEARIFSDKALKLK